MVKPYFISQPVRHHDIILYIYDVILSDLHSAHNFIIAPQARHSDIFDSSQPY